MAIRNHIIVKTRIIEPIKIQIIIRKTEFDENNNWRAHNALSKGGEWITISEGEQYPAECLFEGQVAYEPSWVLSSESRPFAAFDDIETVADILDQTERQGEEGLRYAAFSDTLLKQLSNKLRNLI